MNKTNKEIFWQNQKRVLRETLERENFIKTAKKLVNRGYKQTSEEIAAIVAGLLIFRNKKLTEDIIKKTDREFVKGYQRITYEVVLEFLKKVKSRKII